MAVRRGWLKNKYVLALLIFVMFSAGVHMLSVFIYTLKTLDFEKINYFKILQMDLLFPALKNGPVSYIISLAIAIFGYLTIVMLLRQIENVQS